MANRPVDYVYKAAKRWPNHEFVHVPAYHSGSAQRAAQSYSYAAAVIEIRALSTAYIYTGIAAGVRVGLMLENSAEFFLHWMALNAIGASIVPLNRELSSEEMAHIIRDSKATLITCFPDLTDIANAALKRVDGNVDVWPIGEGYLKPRDRSEIAPEGECALLYTSGSTGLPKGCVLTNDYFETAGQAYVDLGGFCSMTEGQERLATPLPLVHMNALACSTMAMIMTGGCIVQLDRFHPKTWLSEVVAAGATIVHYLGVMPAILLQMPESELEQTHQIKFGFGAGVNPKHHQKFEERFGFPLIEGWSMTEVGGAAWVIASHEPRHVGKCCFGKAPETMDFKIVDDAGNKIATGESGELLVRRAGPDPKKGFFAGYYGQPKLTEDVWQGDWFHTGDIVQMDQERSLYFIDRKKSIIRRSGENISALEVEAVLGELSSVEAVGVTPVPDDIRGEEVLACIVVEHGGGARMAEEVVRYALRKMTYFKVPGYVVFLDELPLTASQKLQRGALKELARDLVEKGSVYDCRRLKKRQKAG